MQILIGSVLRVNSLECMKHLFEKRIIVFLALSWAVLIFNTTWATSREWHVSVSGNDNDSGTLVSPLKHIQCAADKAQPGDKVIIHEGIYRESIAPARGGEEGKPIIYQAAEGEKVVIKGSEVIKDWINITGTIWQVAVPNSLFGDFNPYSDTLHGDWLAKGQWAHTGEVYLNDKALTETPHLEDVLLNTEESSIWYTRVAKDSTWIWADFRGVDPNKELVEINVRRTVFYPNKPFVNYITVRGLQISQAATPWAPPTAEQPGAIGTHWSKGWVIEDNVITHSKCVGITLGKYGDEWDNRAESVDGYIGTTKRALHNKWHRDFVGTHIVRNNRISYCGQAGIAGSLGAIFSQISDNIIHDIGQQNTFWGYELAGIKIHAAIDVLIEHNHIYRTEGGIWLDWMAQGTRVTRNLLHDNEVQDFSLEVNHGPVLVDNNLFLSSELAQVKLSQGVAFVHNLIAWEIWPTGKVDERETPYLYPHDTRIAGYHDCPCGNVSYLNNLFVREDLKDYEDCSLPVIIKGNLLDKQVSFSVKEEKDGWYLTVSLPLDWKSKRTCQIVSIDNLPIALIPQQKMVLPMNAKTFVYDYLGNKRKRQGNCPGALELSGENCLKVKVFCK